MEEIRKKWQRECLEHCDWEDDEEEIQKDLDAENQIEEEKINNQNK